MILFSDRNYVPLRLEVKITKQITRLLFYVAVKWSGDWIERKCMFNENIMLWAPASQILDERIPLKLQWSNEATQNACVNKYRTFVYKNIKIYVHKI